MKFKYFGVSLFTIFFLLIFFFISLLGENHHIDDSIDIHSFAGIFSQIVTNLVMNSLMHGIEDKGTIKLNANYHEKALVFSCEDDGVGINEAFIDKIFDPFYTTKMGSGGSGLGLSIIHNLVIHNLKGEITCTSRVNKGTKISTSFHFESGFKIDLRA